MRLKKNNYKNYRFNSIKDSIEGYYKSNFITTYTINTQTHGFMCDLINRKQFYI